MWAAFLMIRPNLDKKEHIPCRRSPHTSLQLNQTFHNTSFLLHLPDHLSIRFMSESPQRQIHHPLPKTTLAHPPHASEIPKTAAAVSKIWYTKSKCQHIIEKTKSALEKPPYCKN